MSKNFISSDDIRARFSRAMSVMYREEVPAYGTLLELVADVNTDVLTHDAALKRALEKTDNLDRISEERHGAIRLGTAEELKMMSRVFSVMGMQAVGYYDLTQANVPVHSTAFRAVDAAHLSRSPFRVFTSLLRTDLIEDTSLRMEAEHILKMRDIFTPQLRVLVHKAEEQGGLDETDAQDFITQATYTFKWHEQAAVDKDFYEALKDADPRAADIVCFKGPHINHLTPRTLDIDTIHAQMPERGMNAKNVIEGPPPSHNILLRQTSFKALTEKVMFGDVEGAHTARFGEIEQRGAALTPQGRALYDEVLGKVLGACKPAADGSNAAEYMEILDKTFAERFPSDFEDMRAGGLAYAQAYRDDNGETAYTPITYEDFLPVSAAGIFASNADKGHEDTFESSSKSDFEAALGHKVQSEFELYEAMQNKSLESL